MEVYRESGAGELSAEEGEGAGGGWEEAVGRLVAGMRSARLKLGVEWGGYDTIPGFRYFGNPKLIDLGACDPNPTFSDSRNIEIPESHPAISI